MSSKFIRVQSWRNLLQTEPRKEPAPIRTPVYEPRRGNLDATENWIGTASRQNVGFEPVYDGRLKSLVETVDGASIQFDWPAEANSILRPNNMADDLVLAQGWINVDMSQIVGILSTVRNRILSFALEIEASYPNAGEAAPGDTPVPKEDVNRFFQQHITQNFHGPVANVASGHGIEQSGTINIQQGDFRTLATFLQENGVSKEGIRDLETAIKADPQPGQKSKTFGKKVAAWVGKMVTKSAKGAWRVGMEVATKLIVDAIKTHYGMPPLSICREPLTWVDCSSICPQRIGDHVWRILNRQRSSPRLRPC